MSARTQLSEVRGALADAFEAFLAYRRGLGTCHAHLRVRLRHLARFLEREAPEARTLDGPLLERWLATLTTQSPATRGHYLRIARQFCLFQARSDPAVYVPDADRIPRAARPFQPYLYSIAEIRALLAAARRLAGRLRPHSYYTLLLLLYTTGLRLGEAARLTLGDLDQEAGVLQVRQGKFGKARLVPLAPSVLARVTEYLGQRRRAGAPTTPAAPLLWHPGGAYSVRGLQSGLAGLLASVCGKRPGRGGPRVHDLRHAFARHRLCQWYQAGVDVQAKLPLLATYLGHRSFLSTQVYLTATPELLAAANARFHASFGDVLPTAEVSDARHP